MLYSPLLIRAIAVVLLACTICVSPTIAQNASVQDCLGAIPVCQKIYQENQSPSGAGGRIDFGPSIACVVDETNSIWYTFTVNKSGKFGFLLTPNNPVDDYDWVLFDITTASCNDLETDPSLVISCNSAGNVGCQGPTGATGATEYSNQGANCDNLPPSQGFGFSPFNDLIDVIAGNTYVLCINNFLGSVSGYSLDFGLSTDIGIFDETPPTIDDLSLSSDCDGETLELLFSEFIQCATIDESRFELTGPGGPYAITLSGTNCQSGGNFEKRFSMQVSPPISTVGDYTLIMTTNGTSQVLDLCDLPASSQSLNVAFDDIALTLDLGPDTLLCEGQSLILDASSTGATYLWQDGSTSSTFEVTTAGQYSVEVTSACSSVTDNITIGFSSEPAIINLGNDTLLCPGNTLLLDASSPDATYVWQDGSTAPTLTISESGLYTVQVNTECGNIKDEINVDYAAPIDVQLQDTILCEGESFQFDVNTDNATYLWQDGSTLPVYTTNEAGTFSVTIDTECESRTFSAEVRLAAVSPSIDLGADTILCPDTQLLFEFDLPGVDFLWQDGSTNQQYEIIQSGRYSVEASSDCGTVTDAIQVTFLEPLVIDLGQDTFLCPGASIILSVESSATSYEWQDASNDPTFIIREPGIYTLNASNQCQETAATILISKCDLCNIYAPNAFSPNGDGINDSFSLFSNCTMINYQIKVFDRWGALVYEGADGSIGWDGTIHNQLADNGLYIYYIQYEVDQNGRLEEFELSGELTLIR